MFRTYGIVGLVMIILAEIGLFFNLEPFTSFFFLFVWFGYILLIDAIVYRLQKNSLIMNHRWIFFALFVVSALAWWMFEFFNIFFLKNWYYIHSLETITVAGIVAQAKYWAGAASLLAKTIAFSTVVPAVFETAHMLKAFHLFDHARLKRKKKQHHIHKNFLYFLVILGLLCLILSMTLPYYFSALIWVTFFLILDPINYMYHEPSIIGFLRQKKFVIPLAYFIGGYIVGFFWEFWNYWAVIKWKYSLPVLGILENIKLFEMPLLGYIPYGFFALELFAMYYFVRLLRREFIYVERKILHVKKRRKRKR